MSGNPNATAKTDTRALVTPTDSLFICRLPPSVDSTAPFTFEAKNSHVILVEIFNFNNNHITLIMGVLSSSLHDYFVRGDLQALTMNWSFWKHPAKIVRHQRRWACSLMTCNCNRYNVCPFTMVIAPKCSGSPHATSALCGLQLSISTVGFIPDGRMTCNRRSNFLFTAAMSCLFSDMCYTTPFLHTESEFNVFFTTPSSLPINRVTLIGVCNCHRCVAWCTYFVI